MLEFILERYNYIIVIMLMMTGLYIVISRGNLVKTLIGLNLFQTSVFIFYITIGKIAGGTAPILPYPLPGKGYGDGHGGGHGDDGYADKHGGAEVHKAASHGEEAAHGGGEGSANALNETLATTEATENSRESLHSTPEAAAETANDLLAQPASEAVSRGGDEALHTVPAAAEKASGEAAYGADYAGAGDAIADVVYSNPLPHVLILTAIVVGVATTAVGLSLAVRIREAYGTIEEDELEEKDYLAEFGTPLTAPEARGEAG